VQAHMRDQSGVIPKETFGKLLPAWVSEGLVPAIQLRSGGHSSGLTGKW
jgi:hypothetical protein